MRSDRVCEWAGQRALKASRGVAEELWVRGFGSGGWGEVWWGSRRFFSCLLVSLLPLVSIWIRHLAKLSRSDSLRTTELGCVASLAIVLLRAIGN